MKPFYLLPLRLVTFKNGNTKSIKNISEILPCERLSSLLKKRKKQIHLYIYKYELYGILKNILLFLLQCRPKVFSARYLFEKLPDLATYPDRNDRNYRHKLKFLNLSSYTHMSIDPGQPKLSQLETLNEVLQKYPMCTHSYM